MKTNRYYLILPIFIFAAWFTMQAFDGHTGPHNGEIKPSGKFYVEAGHTDQYIFTFLLDSTLRTIPNEGIACRATFVFPDKTVGMIDLFPYGKEGFRAPLIEEQYSTCTFYFEKQGKVISAEYNNNTLVVISQPNE